MASRQSGFKIQRYKTYLQVGDGGYIYFGDGKDANLYADGVGITLTGALTMAGVASGNVLYMGYDNVCTDGIHLRCEASHAMIYINPRGAVEVDYGILINMADLLTMAAGLYILNYKAATDCGIKIAMGGSGTMTDAILLESKVTADGIVNGIRFSAYSVGSITYAFSFKGITGISGAKVGAVCNTDGVDSDAAVKIDIDGTPYFLPAFTAANTSGSW